MARFSHQNTAAAAGLFVAPLVPTIAPVFYAGTNSSGIVSAFYGAFLTYVLALMLGGLLGLSLFYFLGLIRQVNVWTCLLSGLLVGTLCGLLIVLLTGVSSDAVLSYAVQGAGAAAVFWGFWKLGPDPSATFARTWVREFSGSH